MKKKSKKDLLKDKIFGSTDQAAQRVVVFYVDCS